MLLAICALEVWRLTGIPLHEILGLALALAVAAHLLMQRSWVAAHARKPRLDFILNVLLFLNFVAATLSGVMISKYVLPRAVTPVEFLKWHGIHDLSSKFLMLTMGLHVALNWTPLVSTGKAFIRRGARAISSTPPGFWSPRWR